MSSRRLAILLLLVLLATGSYAYAYQYIWRSQEKEIPVGLRIIGHDLAVANISLSKTVVCQGYSMNITAMVENQGSFAEVFNTTLYCSGTIITQLNGEDYITTTLGEGNSTTLTFTWNTTGYAKGNYTIKAVADIVPDEIDIIDNNFTDGWVIVSMVGDITGEEGYPDGKCDIRDVSLVAVHFGQTVPPAPPNCDLTGPRGKPDRKVNIRDISLIARHYGETDP